MLQANRWRRQRGGPLLVGYQEICRELLPAGWEMVEPGLVPVTRWRPEEDVPTIEDEIRFYGLVAREQ